MLESYIEHCSKISSIFKHFIFICTVLLLILADFWEEMSLNSLFLELFQMMTHCNYKLFYLHLAVSDLCDYWMFYHIMSILRGSMQMRFNKTFLKIRLRSRLISLQILVGGFNFLLVFLHFFSKKRKDWILDKNQCSLKEVFDNCFSIYCKNQYLLAYFRMCFAVLTLILLYFHVITFK